MPRRPRRPYQRPTCALIHYSNAPVIMDDRIARGQDDEHGAIKPNGLWVSDEDEFGWRSWCIKENFRLDMLTHAHEVTLSNTANILVLETPGLIREFTIDHGREQPRPSGRRGACWRGLGRRCGGSDLGHRSRSAARQLDRSEPEFS